MRVLAVVFLRSADLVEGLQPSGHVFGRDRAGLAEIAEVATQNEQQQENNTENLSPGCLLSSRTVAMSS